MDIKLIQNRIKKFYFVQKKKNWFLLLLLKFSSYIFHISECVLELSDFKVKNVHLFMYR